MSSKVQVNGVNRNVVETSPENKPLNWHENP